MVAAAPAMRAKRNQLTALTAEPPFCEPALRALGLEHARGHFTTREGSWSPPAFPAQLPRPRITLSRRGEHVPSIDKTSDRPVSLHVFRRKVCASLHALLANSGLSLARPP